MIVVVKNKEMMNEINRLINLLDFMEGKFGSFQFLVERIKDQIDYI